MLKRILLLSTVASFAAFPAFAQDTTTQPAGTTTIEETAPAGQAPAGGDMTQTQPTAEQPAIDQPAAEEPMEAAEAPATPPPSEAIIPAQGTDEVRADTLIGMTVYDTNGEKVGQVKDILFSKDGKATGVVLAVGGVLGLGAKSVGLQWSEVDIQPEAEVAKVQYNKDQLEAAPDFKTQEAQQAEADAAAIQTAPESGSTPTTAPATGTTTTQ